MAKKSAVEKQKRRQAMVARHFEKRKALRETVKNPHISGEERESARIALNKMPRDTSPSRLKNRCLLTGRPKGYMRKFKLSRICFREMASVGLIPGVTKSSW